MNGSSNTSRFKLDEECDYEWPGVPEFTKKMLVTRIGPGKLAVRTLIRCRESGITDSFLVTSTDHPDLSQDRGHRGVDPDHP